MLNIDVIPFVISCGTPGIPIKFFNNTANTVLYNKNFHFVNSRISPGTSGGITSGYQLIISDWEFFPKP